MFLCSVYMAMLLTNWGSYDPAEEDGGKQRYNVGYASAWLLAGTLWVCCCLYLWTLLAPSLFPDRDFTGRG